VHPAHSCCIQQEHSLCPPFTLYAELWFFRSFFRGWCLLAPQNLVSQNLCIGFISCQRSFVLWPARLNCISLWTLSSGSNTPGGLEVWFTWIVNHNSHQKPAGLQSWKTLSAPTMLTESRKWCEWVIARGESWNCVRREGALGIMIKRRSWD